MRVTKTSYWCDYTGLTPQHAAKIGVKIDGGPEGLPAATDDCCVEHMAQHIMDVLRIDPRATIRLTVLEPDEPLDALEAPEADKKYGPCPVCGKRFRSYNGFSGHTNEETGAHVQQAAA